MRIGVVSILLAFDIKEGESSFPVADGQFIISTPRQALENELAGGGSQRSRKIRRAARGDLHRARNRSAKLAIHNKDRKERIPNGVEGDRRRAGRGSGSVQSAKVDVHRQVAVSHDHLFNRAGLAAGGPKKIEVRSLDG